MTPCAVCADQDAIIGHLCRVHADDLHHIIARIPETLHELDTTITRQSAQVRGIQGGGDGHEAMPLHVGASLTRTRMEGHLAGMLAATGHRGPHLDTAERVLHILRNLPAVASHPQIEDRYRELSADHAQAWHLVDIQDTGIVVGECDCQPSGREQPLLVADGLAPTVICPACQARWVVSELIAARQDRVDEVRAMRMPISEAHRALAAAGYQGTLKALRRRVDKGQIIHDDGILLGEAMDVLDTAGKGPRTREGVES